MFILFHTPEPVNMSTKINIKLKKKRCDICYELLMEMYGLCNDTVFAQYK
jgi:hypothetical protein